MKIKSVILKPAAALVAGILATGSANAGLDVAENAGKLIAAQAICGLEYDQVAVVKFVQSIAGDDLNSSANLKFGINIAKYGTRDMTDKERFAWCAMQEGIARAMGLLK